MMPRRPEPYLTRVDFAAFALLAPSVAALADWVGPERFAWPLTGGGGSLGAWLAVWLAERLGPFRLAVVWGALVLGLVLALDRPIVAALRGVRFAARRTGRFAK